MRNAATATWPINEPWNNKAWPPFPYKSNFSIFKYHRRNRWNYFLMALRYFQNWDSFPFFKLLFFFRDMGHRLWTSSGRFMNFSLVVSGRGCAIRAGDLSQPHHPFFNSSLIWNTQTAHVIHLEGIAGHNCIPTFSLCSRLIISWPISYCEEKKKNMQAPPLHRVAQSPFAQESRLWKKQRIVTW